MRILPFFAGALSLVLAAGAAARPAADPSAVEAMILAETNAFRLHQGVPALTADARLTRSARAYAQYLARSGQFSHTADGREPADRAEAAGYDYCEVAENLAWAQDSRDFEAGQLTRILMDGWKTSPGHRRNMLDPQVSQIGVAVVPAPVAPGKYVAVQEFGQPGAARFSFKVINRTGRAATYSLGDKSVRIEPHMVITHTACAAEPLKMAQAAAFRPAAGGVYAVKP